MILYNFRGKASIFCKALVAFFTISLANIAHSENNIEENSQSTVLITGANRGLGLEFATQYRAAGYQVIGTARTPDKADELKATGAEVVKLDVTSEEDIAALADTLKGRKIDILINNAGYFGPIALDDRKKAKMKNVQRQEVTDCFNINTVGPIFITQALLPNLRLSTTPKVINISTRASMISRPNHAAIGYSISKAALNMVTVIMHSHFSREGFIVISLAPGHNKTDMGTDRAKLSPEVSIAKMIPLINSLKPDQSGQFWYYDGSKLAW
ncbi:MAG: SDR family oxidoreductase [Akkermansiaceae bacterium]